MSTSVVVITESELSEPLALQTELKFVHHVLSGTIYWTDSVPKTYVPVITVPALLI